MISRGDVVWADLPVPEGSEAGYRRPVLVVQADRINRSRLATIVCVPLTGTRAWANTPGNLLLPAAVTGLPKDSVAVCAQVLAVDKSRLGERVGRLSASEVDVVLRGLDVILGR